jgi:SOS-response transcriptional repressor LexA
MVACNGEDYGAIPLYDLKVAAGAFSSGQAPEAIGFVYAVGRAGRPGEFIAKVIGNSMDKVAAKGAWCLWQHLGGAGVAAASPGEDILVRRPDGADPDLGQFTFKRLLETSEGRRLAPVSTDPAHQPILLSEADELEATARFVAVVSVAGLD